MQHVRVSTPAELTEKVLAVFSDDPAVSNLSVLRGASLHPAGDLVLADVAREAANEIVDQLDALGLPRCGTIHVEPVTTWVSQAGLDAERHTPGSSADAVVWADVTQRAYEESEPNWTHLAFMTLATLLASIAIVVDSQTLVVGAMVLGPEFVAIAALGMTPSMSTRSRRSMSAPYPGGRPPVLDRRARMYTTRFPSGRRVGPNAATGGRSSSEVCPPAALTGEGRSSSTASRRAGGR
jgi:hypothetical protein